MWSGILLKTLLTLKPLNLEATLALAKVFKNLANSATFYQRPDLLSAYFKGNALSQYGRLASVLGVSGVGFMIAAVTLTLVAYFVPPFLRFILRHLF